LILQERAHFLLLQLLAFLLRPAQLILPQPRTACPSLMILLWPPLSPPPSPPPSPPSSWFCLTNTHPHKRVARRCFYFGGTTQVHGGSRAEHAGIRITSLAPAASRAQRGSRW
jgi:hypothetical protein